MWTQTRNEYDQIEEVNMNAPLIPLETRRTYGSDTSPQSTNRGFDKIWVNQNKLVQSWAPKVSGKSLMAKEIAFNLPLSTSFLVGISHTPLSCSFCQWGITTKMHLSGYCIYFLYWFICNKIFDRLCQMQALLHLQILSKWYRTNCSWQLRNNIQIIWPIFSYALFGIREYSLICIHLCMTTSIWANSITNILLLV